MKLITRDTDYALRALRAIAVSSHRTVPVSGLVTRLGVPRPFLRKVLQQLTRKKILTSVKGNQGGFSLARPAGRIKVTDVIRIFQGPVQFQRCVIGTKCCPDRRTCLLRKKVKEIEAYALRVLEETTLQDLLDKSGGSS